MADLASTGVTILKGYTEGGNNGKKFRVLEVSMVLAAMGTTTNKILASVFGLTTIKSCTPLTKDDNTLIVVAAPSADGTMLLLKAAATNAPADATGTFTCTISGN